MYGRTKAPRKRATRPRKRWVLPGRHGRRIRKHNIKKRGKTGIFSHRFPSRVLPCPNAITLRPDSRPPPRPSPPLSRILSAPAAVLEQQISSARSFVDDREQPNEDSNPRAKLAYERCRHGTPAYKHSTRGRKERWIQLSDDSSALNWMSADRKKKRGFIPLLSVVRVSSGCQTSVFRRAISAGSIDATADAESRCFSLVCRDKSLDLEVASAASREQWVADLRLIAGLMPADGEQ